MSKLYGRERRCHLCFYWTKKEYNLQRHMERKHYGVADSRLLRLIRDGVYQCKIHDVPIKYNTL